MPSDISFLEFMVGSENAEDSAEVFPSYLQQLANKKLRLYKDIIQYGAKAGQSYYGHILDLVTVAEKLRPMVGLDTAEMRCLLLALTVHDLNKLPNYNYKASNYANAATPENIKAELERLEIDLFFPEWRDYLPEIVYLAHAHQVAATGTTLSFDQRELDKCLKLSARRLKGPLSSFMKAADSSDLSHSGDHRDPHETHLRDKLLQHINAASPDSQFRFIGHRLAELRGLFTNVIHNVLVDFFRQKYAAIDLLYYPEGVNYLLDNQQNFEWNKAALAEVAGLVEQILARIQAEDLAQFIKGKPVGIVVDDAAIASGVSLHDIFEEIAKIVFKKQYKLEWRAERNTFARNDLQEALADPKQTGLHKTIQELLQQPELIPQNETVLKRGEFLAAYRKFLEDHRAEALKTLKLDAWTRVYGLFELPEAVYPLCGLIDPYRRGFFLARYLPEIELDQLMEKVLADIEALEDEAQTQKTTKTAVKGAAPEPKPEGGYILDYLKRNLEVWVGGQAGLSRPLLTHDFGDSLRQYANAKRPHEQCCHCGSPLKASEWMSTQVPPSLGVQSFSNRLEGGSGRDPKRNVCEVCRSQFILEKLAWRSHRDKQGSEQLTFYLHLFPYAFFTRPLLDAWWVSLESLRQADSGAFFISTKEYFRELRENGGEISVKGYKTGVNGMSLPTLSESMSNTPILPIVAVGDNYGLQFIQALEEAVILAQWFECRVLLSRSPVPPLNLSQQTIEGQPVALMVEGRPRNLSWLLPETSLCRQAQTDPQARVSPEHELANLFSKLSALHQLSDKLYYPGSDGDEIVHNFAAAAADDPLALFYEADRLIEKKVAAEKGKGKAAPEQQALYLTAQVAPILEKLVNRP